MNRPLDARSVSRIAAFLLAFAASRAPAQESIFPDKKLEAAVRPYVFEKRFNEQPITEEDVKTISQIVAKKKGIANLAGLEKCRSLALLDLAGNEIADLNPIKDLKGIQSLDLSKNKIEDLGPIAGLVALQYLHLAGNRIADLKPLAKLPKLVTLHLSQNKLKDLAVVGELKKLWSLYLDGNPEIEDIKVLGGLKDLSSLDLRGCAVQDLAPLEPLTELRYLLLDNNKVSDLSVLVRMAQKDSDGEKRFAPFWNLHLTGNPLSDAAKGEQIPALKKLVRELKFDEKK